MGVYSLIHSLWKGNLLLPGQVEWVSTSDLIISFLYIYPRVLVLRIWLQGPLGLLRSFYGVFEVRTIFIIILRPICLFHFSFWYQYTVEVSRASVTSDKIIAVTANRMFICIYMCFNSVLISTILITIITLLLSPTSAKIFWRF